MMESIRHIGSAIPATHQRKIGPDRSFSEELRQSILAGKSVPKGERVENTGITELGRISEENPTVSHLLVSHPLYRDACWEIVHSKANSGKPFRNLPVGRPVSLNPKTGEIFCGGSDETVGLATLEKRDLGDEQTSRIRADLAPSSSLTGFKKSHMARPEGGSRIRIASTTDNTARLFFCKSVRTDLPESNSGRSESHVANTPPTDSPDLTSALRSYIGTPYSKINCFELVVEGLKDVGIRYGGRQGLQNSLIRKALAQGLPMNAYLTGEGLIDMSSTKVFESTYADVTDSKTQARRVLDEMKPILEPGLILSFSTETRGHTGIVARYGGQWTFLNSGDLDHDVRPSAGKKGVGEEQLEAEIANWLRRAGRSGESLKITVGKIDNRKIVTFLNPDRKSDAHDGVTDSKTSV